MRRSLLTSAPEERARHLALAADGPDAGVAAALDEAARLARARGAPGEAAELLEEARRLTPPDADADALRRAVDAAGHHFEAGDARRARALLDEAHSGAAAGCRARASAHRPRPRPLVRRRHPGGRGAAGGGGRRRRGGAARAGPRTRDPRPASSSGCASGSRRRSSTRERRSRSRASSTTPELAAAALGSLVLAEAALGVRRGAGDARAADAVGSSGRGTRAMGGAEFQVAVVRMWWEQLDEAKASFERMLAVAEEIGDESSVPYIHVLLAQTECLRGRFGEAAAHADEGALRAEQVGQETLVAYALALRALADAHRGDEDAARSAAAQALALAGSTSGRPAEHFATAALGLLELSLGRNAEAVDVLTPLVAFARQQELREPGMTRFVPGSGRGARRLRAARRGRGSPRLVRGERRAARARRPARARRRAVAACSRRARGDLAGALAALEQRSRATTTSSPLPFDRARTLLALGVARRRANDRRRARATLEEARDVLPLARLPRLWEQRAAEELARIGGRAPALRRADAGRAARRRARRRRAARTARSRLRSSSAPAPSKGTSPASTGSSACARGSSSRASCGEGQSHVVPPFFAQPPPPSVEASLDEPDRTIRRGGGQR